MLGSRRPGDDSEGELCDRGCGWKEISGGAGGRCPLPLLCTILQSFPRLSFPSIACTMPTLLLLSWSKWWLLPLTTSSMAGSHSLISHQKEILAPPLQSLLLLLFIRHVRYSLNLSLLIIHGWAKVPAALLLNSPST